MSISCRHHLDKCIDSILVQTYKNIEVILVDDGSTDRCPQICDAYAERDSRIKVIHKENGGLSSARNVGLENASGKFISFIDSDDFIHPQMIEKMYFAIIRETADMCICGMKWINEDQSEYTNVLPCPIGNCVYIDDKKYDVFNNPAYFYYVTSVNKLYKKEVFDKISFPLGKRNEDEFTAHHIFGACSKIVCIENLLYYYVQRDGSIMNSEFSIKKFDAIDAFADRTAFFADKNLTIYRDSAAYKAYAVLYSLLVNEDVYVYRKVFSKYVLKVLKLLKLNLRAVKLLIPYILKIVHGSIKYNLVKAKFILKSLDKKSGRCVIAATPTHGNLGDQAIVFAEKNILKTLYPHKKIFEISNDTYLRFPELCKRYINQKDIVIIDGGGNLGSLWQYEDKKISRIISDFKDNKICIFPQTCYYDMKNDMELIDCNRKIYENASELTVMLRDKHSYDIFKELYPNVCSTLIPDIVLSLKPNTKSEKQSKVLLCFRDDVEKNIKDDERATIERCLHDNGISYGFTSTLINSRVGEKSRKKALQNKWKEFSSAQLIITDRLHAMIFSAITATPCIALDNISKKVSGAYAWIENIDYISCVDNVDELVSLIPVMLKISNCSYDFNYPITQIKEIME